uniref:MSP domain-containing protein n=1 Tax=Heterorhabditis bacteriophora TaxID=37862 RepID=A0A1I7X9N9_HETBA
MSFLTVDPPACMVPSTGGSSIHQLSNAGEVRLVFKVKSSNNTEYCIKPVFGFVDAGTGAPLEITRMAGIPKEDKLVILFGAAPDGVVDPAEAFKSTQPMGSVTIPLSAQ